MASSLPIVSSLGTSGTALTRELVEEARRRVHAGETIKDVARDMGVDRTTLWYAVRGHTWEHIQDPAPLEPPRVLTPELVAEVRSRVRAGATLAQATRGLHLYFVGYPALLAAVRGYTWPGPVLGQAPVPLQAEKSRHGNYPVTANPTNVTPQ